MKKIFYTLLLTTAALVGKAQCSDLFISEYVEGTYNNKAIELYNPTNSPIELSNYRIVRWSNGETNIATLETNKEILPIPSATIAAKDVYVLVINTSDVGTDTIPFVELSSKADVQLCTSCDPNSGSIRTLCFNGDDALSLQKNVNGNWVNIDIFGLIGERPTNGAGGTSPTGAWTDQAPYSSRPTSIASNVYFLYYWSQDQTLVRKPTVLDGVTTNPGVPYTGAWNPATQWDSLPENTFTQLGTHVCNCNEVGVNENNANLAVTVYPNPATEFVNVRLNENISKIEVFNVAGQVMQSITPAKNTIHTKFDVRNLNAGVYLVRVETEKGRVAIKKITIQ